MIRDSRRKTKNSRYNCHGDEETLGVPVDGRTSFILIGLGLSIKRPLSSQDILKSKRTERTRATILFIAGMSGISRKRK